MDLNLAAEFARAAQYMSEMGITAKDAALFIADKGGGAILGTAAGALASGWYVKKKADKKIEAMGKKLENDEIDSEQIIISVTYYEPTGQINAKTGKEIYTQRMPTLGSRHIGDLLKDETEEVRAWFQKYIKIAKEKCTEENPFILSHLEDVMPEDIKKKEKIMQKLQKNIVNFSSAEGVDKNKTLVAIGTKNNRQALKNASFLAALVYEPGADKKQMRLLLMETSLLKKDAIPDLEDVQYPVKDQNGDEIFIHDPTYYQALRVTTLQNLANAYRKNASLFAPTVIDIPTGETKYIPTPSSNTNQNLATHEVA